MSVINRSHDKFFQLANVNVPVGVILATTTKFLVTQFQHILQFHMLLMLAVLAQNHVLDKDTSIKLLTSTHDFSV